VSSYNFYWEVLNHKSDATENFQLLSDLAVGVAGGSGISRADYIYDNVNLPEVRRCMRKLHATAAVEPFMQLADLPSY